MPWEGVGSLPRGSHCSASQLHCIPMQCAQQYGGCQCDIGGRASSLLHALSWIRPVLANFEQPARANMLISGADGHLPAQGRRSFPPPLQRHHTASGTFCTERSTLILLSSRSFTSARRRLVMMEKTTVTSSSFRLNYSRASTRPQPANSKRGGLRTIPTRTAPTRSPSATDQHLRTPSLTEVVSTAVMEALRHTQAVLPTSASSQRRTANK
jgi:hypothetical protein